jgi:hypothetical protein
MAKTTKTKSNTVIPFTFTTSFNLKKSDVLNMLDTILTDNWPSSKSWLCSKLKTLFQDGEGMDVLSKGNPSEVTILMDDYIQAIADSKNQHKWYALSDLAGDGYVNDVDTAGLKAVHATMEKSEYWKQFLTEQANLLKERDLEEYADRQARLRADNLKHATMKLKDAGYKVVKAKNGVLTVTPPELAVAQPAPAKAPVDKAKNDYSIINAFMGGGATYNNKIKGGKRTLKWCSPKNTDVRGMTDEAIKKALEKKGMKNVVEVKRNGFQDVLVTLQFAE